MGKVYALSQRKGGVGKTLSALTLAVEFARQGFEDVPEVPALKAKELGRLHLLPLAQTPPEIRSLETARVLAVEMDTQRNLSKGLGIDVETWRQQRVEQLKKGEPQEDEFYSVYEVLLNPEYGVEYAIYATPWGVDVLPAVAAMSGIERDLYDSVARESRLRSALREAGTEDYAVTTQAVDKWQAIFVDTGPNLGILTLNAMAVADYILIPVEMGEDSLDGVDEVLVAVREVRRINKNLKVGGIFCTKFDPRNKLSHDIVNEVRARHGSLVFETVIPLNTRIAETPSVRKPIQIYDPGSLSALAYARLAQEIKQRCP